MCLPACSKAEKEVELVAQDNERMFRQVGTPSRHTPLRLNGRVALIRDLQDSRDTWAWARYTQSNTLPAPGPAFPHACLPACLQLNFVRTRLMGQLAGLDPAVPDIGKLARELQVGVSGGPAFVVGGWREERRWVVCSLLDGWKDGRNGAAC
jgi:hypothetical protein